MGDHAGRLSAAYFRSFFAARARGRPGRPVEVVGRGQQVNHTSGKRRSRCTRARARGRKERREAVSSADVARRRGPYLATPRRLVASRARSARPPRRSRLAPAGSGCACQERAAFSCSSGAHGAPDTPAALKIGSGEPPGAKTGRARSTTFISNAAPVLLICGHINQGLPFPSEQGI